MTCDTDNQQLIAVFQELVLYKYELIKFDRARVDRLVSKINELCAKESEK